MSSPFSVRARSRHTNPRIRRGFASSLAVFVLALSAPVFATEAPLTLAAAQRLAVERSRLLDARDLAVFASRDMAVAAGQLPDPVLKLGVENLPVNGQDRFNLSSSSMTMRSVGVMQQITRADKRRLRSERYELQAEKNLAEKNQAIASIQRDSALAWLNLYYLNAAAKVVAEQGQQAALEVQAAEGAYRADRGNRADIFASRSALSMFDDRASKIAQRVTNARIMLARWIGPAAEMPLSGIPATDAIRLDPAKLDTHLKDHPQIAVLGKQVGIAEAEAMLAKANKKPDWSVELMYSQRGPDYSDMISVGVSIPLQWDQKNRQNRELSSKLALVEQAKAEREDVLLAYVAETRSMINEWENDRQRHARYERELIPLANEQTSAAVTAYRGGKAGLADVLKARRNEIDVRLRALELEADTARQWAELNYLFPADAVASHPIMSTNGDQNEN